MQFAGPIPPDAPDPRAESIARLRAMPIPVLGFVSQPHLEDWGAIGVGSSSSSLHGVEGIEAAITYTLWRNPDDHADPANLADLDEATRAALDVPPPWPRPQWLIDGAERMRYRMLWEAVRTTWHRSDGDHSRVEDLLVHHANYVLRNRFREQLGLGDMPGPPRDRGFEVAERNVQHGFALEVEGRVVDGVRIDTDPFVYAVGADLGSGGTLTAVVPRDDLPYVMLAFAERPLV